MPAPAALGRPVVVYANTGLCDRAHHEVDLYTDGRRAFATHTDSANDCEQISRDGTTITVVCDRLLPNEEKCDGTITFQLDEPSRWVTRSEAIDTLVREGDLMTVTVPDLPDSIDVRQMAKAVLADLPGLAVWAEATGAPDDATAITWAQRYAHGPEATAHVRPF